MSRVVLLLAGVALVAACGKRPSPESEPMQGDGAKLYRAPAFSFAEARGGRVTAKRLHGKVWLATFIFTRCQTSCLTICAELAKLQEEFGADPDFRIISTTVDPDYDSPQILRRFARKYGAREKTWLFLTGKQDDIRRFAYDGLHVSWDPEAPLLHSTRIMLIDRDGWVRGSFPAGDPGRVARLHEVLRAVLAEPKAP